jgi:release factor glutamine methyltransferase
MTLRDLLTEASAHISRRDAETLLAHFLVHDRAWLFAHSEIVLTPQHAHNYRHLVARRAAHEPLQYLTGVQEFYGHNLRVTRKTLIPRPETELLVEAVLHWLSTQSPVQPSPRILDIGTGSGAIAIAIAHKLPAANIHISDISPAILEVARDNAARLHLDAHLHLHVSDLLAAPSLQKAAPFDVIVSNPPYIPLTDAPTLQPEVVHHEPHTALFAGPDGLDIYRRLIPQVLRSQPHPALRPGGLLALEFGCGQREALRHLLESQPSTPWQNIQFQDDYANIPRIALATRHT